MTSLRFFYFEGSGSCKTKDDDYCIQKSPGWGKPYTCGSSIKYCEEYGKDMRRCCPDTCGTGPFTEADCNNHNSMGTCTYPNGAQCEEGKMFYLTMHYKLNKIHVN